MNKNNREKFPINKVYRFIEPGPVLLVATEQNGIPNVMTIGFHMMVQHESPALIGAVIGPWDYSHEALKKNKECVLAVPTVDLIKKVVDIGNCSGSDEDKFKKFKLTTAKATLVTAPLIEECLLNIECKVANTKLVNSHSLFVLEAVNAWINPDKRNEKIFHHRGDGTFSIDGKIINLRERMTKWKMFQD